MKDILENLNNSTKLGSMELLSIGKMVAIGKITRGFIHELNQPLTGVVGFSQLLAREEISIKQAKEFGEIIEKQSYRMDSLIKRFKEFVREEVDDFQYINIKECMENTISFFRFHATRDNINIKQTYPKDVSTLSCYCSLNQLQIFFIHLLSDMMSITNTVKSSKKKISIKVSSNKGETSIYTKLDFKDLSPNKKIDIFSNYIPENISTTNDIFSHQLFRLIANNHKGHYEIALNKSGSLKIIMTLPQPEATK